MRRWMPWESGMVLGVGEGKCVVVNDQVWWPRSSRTFQLLEENCAYSVTPAVMELCCVTGQLGEGRRLGDCSTQCEINQQWRVIYQEENGCTEQAKMDEKLRPDAGRLNFYQYWFCLLAYFHNQVLSLLADSEIFSPIPLVSGRLQQCPGMEKFSLSRISTQTQWSVSCLYCSLWPCCLMEP